MFVFLDRFRVFDDTVFGYVRRCQNQQHLHVENDGGHSCHGERYGTTDRKCGTLTFVRQTGRPKTTDGRPTEAQQ